MNTYSEEKIYENYSNEVERMQKCIDELQQENKILKENAENNDKVVDKVNWENMLLKKENKQLNGTIQTYDILLKSNIEENKKLKDKLSKIETLLINHNYDTGYIYYKYNSRFLKSELKQRILEILEDKEVSE